MPLKSSHNKQRAVIHFFVDKRTYDTLPTVRTWPPLTIIFWADEENATWAEICIRYQSAISHSSVAWTAASIVLCNEHSQTC